ncbi:MAG: glycosyltransferase [Bacteroidota bacterium]
MQETQQILVSLVIPCYNESDRIVHLEQGVREFRQKWDDSYEIIVVDDGSKDNTSDLIRQRLPQVQLITLRQNQGKGGALRAGVLAAKGQFILTLDADMAAHPLELQKWLDLLPAHRFSSNQILIASRNHPASKINAKSHRKFAGQIFNTLVQSLTPIKLSDTQCGFKLYPRPIGQLLFQDLYTRGWAHDIELLYKAAYLHIEIVAMPIEWKHVDAEKINVMSDGIKMARETSLMAYRYRFVKRFRKELQSLKAAYQQLNQS